MKHGHILASSAKHITSHNDDYGTPGENFARAAKIASLILNTEISPYAIAVIFHAMKLSRMSESPDNLDHYVDGISFLAFAGEFCMAQSLPKPDAQDGTVPTRIADTDTARLTNGPGPQN